MAEEGVKSGTFRLEHDLPRLGMTSPSMQRGCDVTIKGEKSYR
jgi:hypothetical protein